MNRNRWIDVARWVLLPGLASFTGLWLISLLSMLDIDRILGEEQPLLLGAVTLGISIAFMVPQSLFIRLLPKTSSDWLVLQGFGGFTLTLAMGAVGLWVMTSLPTMKGWYVVALIVFFLMDTAWVAGCYIVHVRKIASTERRIEEEIENIGNPQQ